MTGGNYSLTGGFWSLISVVQTAGVPNLDHHPFRQQRHRLLAEHGQLHVAAIILAGFAIGTWMIGQGEWRWLFRIPPIHHRVHGRAGGVDSQGNAGSGGLSRPHP
jgi:hypothetical protein